VKSIVITVFFSILLGAVIGGLIHKNFFTNKLDLNQVKEIEMCEPSIRSLEQELRTCFYHSDKILELVGIDVFDISRKRDMWKDRAVKASIKIDKLKKECRGEE